MSLLDHPTAQALLNDAELDAATVRSCGLRLQGFLERYLPRFYRVEHHRLATIVVQGKLSQLERKTCEPIAIEAGLPRKPVQRFVGAGGWDDEAVMSELRRHVAEEGADPEAVLVLDPSAFVKKGTASCGVDRQWCGRLGKVENCQVGVFAAYVTGERFVLVDRQLYLPAEWAADEERREQTHVPAAVVFQERWRLALNLVDRTRAELPFAWVAGDDELGRASQFRAGLRSRDLCYVLDVPCNTLIRELGTAMGGRVPPWQRADVWAKAQPPSRWRKVRVGDGSQGPKVYWAVDAWVQTKDDDGHVGARERLVVLRSLATAPQVWYALAHAPTAVPLRRVVTVHSQRHGVEEALQAAKGEVGLGHYEVRSWTGWHHHMTLSLLALWFLVLERERLKKKRPP